MVCCFFPKAGNVFWGGFGCVFFSSRSRLNPETLLAFCFLEEREGRCPATHPHICEDVLVKRDACF